MRRKDREIIDPQTIRSIIEHCRVMRVAFCADNIPYLVPLNFGFEETAQGYSFFFHSAHEGRKIDMLRQNPRVAFELDYGHALISAEKAVDYSYAYQSIIGEGTAEIITDTTEKIRLLQIFMLQQSGKNFTITPAEAEIAAICRSHVTALSAKAQLK